MDDSMNKDSPNDSPYEMLTRYDQSGTKRDTYGDELSCPYMEGDNYYNPAQS
jgi:hypothetical protein